MDLKYEELFKDFRDKVSTDSAISAKDITKRVVEYFAKKYDKQTVLYSNKNEKKSEYLTDVLVTTFEPKVITKKKNKKFEVSTNEIKALLAIESELGGEGGTSAGPVQKNVIEDFIKLLLIKSKYKVMIFSSVPLDDEDDYLNNRVNSLMQVKNNSDSSGEEILLIHIFGNRHKSESGNPRQIDVSLQSSGIKGFLLKEDGKFIQLNT